VTLLRTAVLLLIGVAMFEGRAGSLVPAAVAVAAAALAAWRLPRPGSLVPRPLGVLRFLPYFARQSISGGLDVALRALRPGRTVAPTFVEYRTGIRDPGLRVLFANTVSLLPGTFTAELRDDVLSVHVLDGGLPVDERLRDLEARLRSAFRDDG
jgi:multicomponent Na+:H+ antiporter subunit E